MLDSQNQTSVHRCAGARLDGAACGNRPLLGSAYCQWHRSRPAAEQRPLATAAAAAAATPTLLDLRAAAYAAGAPGARPPRTLHRPRARAETAVIPARVRQLTTEEVRILVEGVANGPSRRYWRRAADGSAYTYAPRPDGHELWLRPPTVDGGDPAPGPAKWLEQTLDAWGLDAAFLYLMLVGILIEVYRVDPGPLARGDVVPVVELDTGELLDSLGLRPRYARERLAARCWLAARLREFSRVLVVGMRRGTYRLPGRSQVEDTYLQEALLTLEDAAPPPAGVPLRVRVMGGSTWMQRGAHNPRLRQYIGNLRAIAAIPAGQATGQWARAMGLTYAQLAREALHKRRPREAYSRRELLTRLPPRPSVEAVLGGGNPRRALEYWHKAKRELVRVGIWNDFAEPPPPPHRYGWAEAWLAQQVRPSLGPVLATREA